MFQKATYLSADEVERADALALGYERVCQHPLEVGILGADDVLILDLNRVQWADLEAGASLALNAARSGVPVGIHAFQLPLAFRELLTEPLVVIAKTHRKVRVKVRRLIESRRAVILPYSPASTHSRNEP